MTRKSKLLAFYGLVTTLGIYLNLVYGSYYQLRWLFYLSFIMTLSFPFYIYSLCLNYAIDKSFGKIVNAILFFICVGPFYYVLTEGKDRYVRFQLNKYGVKTYGIITDYKTNNTKSGLDVFSTFDYECNNKTFTQRISNIKLEYKVGDTVRLITSTDNPSIIEILGVDSN